MESKQDTRPEFEKKFLEVRQHTRRHTVESLTSYAGEYLRGLEEFIIERNGVYEGTVLPKVTNVTKLAASL